MGQSKSATKEKGKFPLKEYSYVPIKSATKEKGKFLLKEKNRYNLVTSSDVTRNLGTKAYDPWTSYDKREAKIKYRLKNTILDGPASNKAPNKEEQYKASNTYTEIRYHNIRRKKNISSRKI